MSDVLREVDERFQFAGTSSRNYSGSWKVWMPFRRRWMKPSRN